MRKLEKGGVEVGEGGKKEVEGCMDEKWCSGPGEVRGRRKLERGGVEVGE